MKEFRLLKADEIECRVSRVSEKGVALPHLMVIDLGSEQTITGFDYLPRAEEGAPGSIKDYKIFVY